MLPFPFTVVVLFADGSPALVRCGLSLEGHYFSISVLRAPAPTLQYGGVCGMCYYVTV